MNNCLFLIFLKATIEANSQVKDSAENVEEQNESIPSNDISNQMQNIVSTTMTSEKNPESINELSSIEKIDRTTIIDHTSTLTMTSINNTYSTDRHLVLTTSSLDENQKVYLENENFDHTKYFLALFLVNISSIHRTFWIFNKCNS